jgi:xylulokinase
MSSRDRRYRSRDLWVSKPGTYSSDNSHSAPAPHSQISSVNLSPEVGERCAKRVKTDKIALLLSASTWRNLRDDLLLAVDAGTSRIKVALFNRTGERVALASEATQTISPQADWVEQDPNVWWESSARMIRVILKRNRIERGAIQALAVTGQMHGPVLLDSKARPLGNCIIWQDRRAKRETDEINSKVSERTLYRLSGYRLNPHMTGPKLLWIRKKRRELYMKARRIVLPKDYLRSRFTGDLCTDWTDANGTGLFNMRKKTWAYDIFDELGLDAAKMPEIKPSFEVVGETNESASRKTGLDKGIPVVAGAGDDVVAIGTGAVSASDLVVNIGTSSSTYTRLSKPMLDPLMRLECFVGCEEGKWLLSGTTTSAGASVDWITRNLGTGHSERNRNTYSVLDRLPPRKLRPSGLLFLPYLAGERSPIWNANAKGELVGITLRHGRLDLIQGVLEGVCFTLRSILDITEQLTGRKMDIVRVAGAATSSVAWMQILANILGRKVSIPRESETTALGAAMLAAVGIGLAPNVAKAAQRFQHVIRTVVPQTRVSRAYEAAYEQFTSMSNAHIMRT